MSGGRGLSTKGVGRPGLPLATKGVVDAYTAAVTAVSRPEGTITVATTRGPIVIVVPTAPNICLLASENIVDNLRQGQAANLVLPSLYKRAYMVANVTDEIALTRQSGP